MQFSASVGAEHPSLCLCCLLFALSLLLDLCAFGLRCLGPALAALLVQSQQPLIVGSAYAMTA